LVTGGGVLAYRTREEERPTGQRTGEAVRQPVRGSNEGMLVERPKVAQRIVFAGDSITDGHTYPLLVRQALVDAGRPVPLCINAGVAADTADGLRRRLERDVFVHRPSLVVFNAGIYDAIRNVPPAGYEAAVRAIAEQVRANNASLLLLTTSLLGPGYAAAEKHLAGYNAVLHRLGEEYGYPVAEVDRRMQAARAAGQNIIEGDNINPTFEGQRLMARAVLDALGCE